MIKKNFMALDLEYNQPSGSIIQVGAVVGNLDSGEILEEYSAYIKVEEKISGYIINLTGIRQEDTDQGIDLKQSYKHLTQMHQYYKCFRNAVCWGGGDSHELRKQLGWPDEEMFLFGRRWIDAKTLFVSLRFARNQQYQAGLAKALLKFNMEFKGKKHQACDDARNTFFIYRRMLQEFKND